MTAIGARLVVVRVRACFGPVRQRSARARRAGAGPPGLRQRGRGRCGLACAIRAALRSSDQRVLRIAGIPNLKCSGPLLEQHDGNMAFLQNSDETRLLRTGPSKQSAGSLRSMPGYCRSPSCQGLSGAVSEFCANCRSCCTHETRGSSPSRQHVAGVFVSPFATEDAQRGRDGPAPDHWVVALAPAPPSVDKGGARKCTRRHRRRVLSLQGSLQSHRKTRTPAPRRQIMTRTRIAR